MPKLVETQTCRVIKPYTILYRLSKPEDSAEWQEVHLSIKYENDCIYEDFCFRPFKSYRKLDDVNESVFLRLMSNMEKTQDELSNAIDAREDFEFGCQELEQCIDEFDDNCQNAVVELEQYFSLTN